MSDASLLWLIGGAVAVVWVVIAQVRTRILRQRAVVVVVVLRWVLLGYGVVLVALVLRSQGSPSVKASALLATLAVAAIGLGIVRGAVTTIWTDRRGRMLRRGGIVVIALWVLSFGVHLVVDWLLDRDNPGLGPTTMLAYLVATLAAQNITVRRRAATLRARA